MMREEFEKLTGFYPTADMYSTIEEAYLEFDGEKQAFCKAYTANANGMAEAIQRKHDMAKFAETERIERERREQAQQASKRIAELEAQFESELEWKPFEDAHNVSQADYEKLAKCTPNMAYYMTDEQAIDWVVQETGFDRSKIRILHEVAVEEINRHHQVRVTGKKLDRRPVYCATDYHYILFSVKANVTHYYELWHDEIRPYWN